MATLASVPKDLAEFIEAQAINGLVLLSLTDEDLETIPLKKFGHRRLLLLAAKQLRARASSDQTRPADKKSSACAPVARSGSSPSPAVLLEDKTPDVDVNTVTNSFYPTKATTTLPCTSPSRSSSSRVPEAIREVSSRKGLSASASAHTIDAVPDATTRKHYSAISVASPKLSALPRTSTLPRTNSSPSPFLCNPLLHAPRRCSPERRPPSPLLRRAASPEGRSASPVRQSRAVLSTRPVGTSGSQPQGSDGSMASSGGARGSLRVSASSRRVGTTVPRQPQQSRPRSPPRSGWTPNGPARHAPATAACKRGSPTFATP